ncbi:LysM peptidoglycan-binding domain-containing protein [Knoellia sp. CPCC 206450]|uniref:LysM peptidoglycan-binding domain-containing protein n=1 Tax=Knoellia tibetensis TaxID=3404798 RepID=UPI003B428DBE
MQTASNDLKDASTTAAIVVTRTARVLAVGLLALAVVVSMMWVLWLAWLSAWARVGSPGPASTPELLTLGAASAAIAIAAWLCLGAALEVLSHLPGRTGALAGRWSDRLTPALARRVAAFVLGIGVGVAGGPSQAVGASRDLDTAVSTSTAPAPGFQPTRTTVERAAPTPGFRPTSPAEGAQQAPAPGFQPTAQPGTRPASADAAAPPPTPGFTPSAPRVRKQADPTLLGSRASGVDRSDVYAVVVHRGDTLWSIAAAHLGPDADDAEVARAWPRWFEANRDVIGHDPDLLLPGQVLRVPDPSASAVR